jgi:hypothetical protein
LRGFRTHQVTAFCLFKSHIRSEYSLVQKFVRYVCLRVSLWSFSIEFQFVRFMWNGWWFNCLVL